MITLIFSGGKNYSSRGKYYSLRIFFLHQISTFFTGQILSLVLFLSLVPVFCDKLIFTLYSTLYSVQYDFHYNVMSSWRLMYTVVPMSIQDFIKKSFRLLILCTNLKFLVTWNCQYKMWPSFCNRHATTANWPIFSV